VDHVVRPDVTVTHVKGGSSGASRSARLNYAFHYGMWRFYRKHYASAHNPVVNALVYAGIGLKFVLSWAAALCCAFGRHRPVPAPPHVAMSALVSVSYRRTGTPAGRPLPPIPSSLAT
jgi:cation transporter-like permease